MWLTGNCILSNFAIFYHAQTNIMRKLKLFIASSLDGYIARPDGTIDWLPTFLRLFLCYFFHCQKSNQKRLGKSKLLRRTVICQAAATETTS
jgi:hypothetical protein